MLSPPGEPVVRRLTPKADTIQSFGLDLRPVLSGAGTGLVWAALKDGGAVGRSPHSKDPKAALLRRPGHEPRAHREGQPAAHARDGHPARRRGAGGGRAASPSAPPTTPSSGAASRTRTASRRPRARPCATRAILGAALPGHGGEGRRRRLRGQRLERRAGALELRPLLRARRGAAAAARIRVQRPRRLPPRRGGALQGHPAQRHRGGDAPARPGHRARDRGPRQPERGAGQAHALPLGMEQRGLGLPPARGRAPRQLRGAGDGGGAEVLRLRVLPRRRLPASRLPRRREPRGRELAGRDEAQGGRHRPLPVRGRDGRP